jgi:hypothetical protein
LDENEDISTNNYIEYINSEGEPINRRVSISKIRLSRASEYPFEDSNNKNISKSITNSSQSNTNVISINNYVNNDIEITQKFENKFLVLESRNSIFYNPENHKTTAYININKNDFTDLNDIRNQIIFFGIKDINSKDYFVKPRLSNKKNISLFINSDLSFNNNNSKILTESNVSDLNISASNVSAFNNNNINERKNIRSHSNVLEYVPDYKAYAVEKSLNILILHKKKTEAQTGNKADNLDDFKKFRKDHNRKV